MPQRRRTKKRMTAKDLFRLVVPGEPCLSPDGRLVAFSLTQMDLKKNRYFAHVCVVPAAGGRVSQVTQGEQVDSCPVFSPSGRHLAFISNREEKANIWVMPVGGGEPRRLTDFEAGSIRSLVWSPDGRELAFMRRDLPKEDKEKKKLEPSYKQITKLYHREDGLGFYDGHWWHIWKVGFPNGRSQQLTRGDQNDTQPAWSPDSRSIAFVSNRVRNADLNLENSDVFLISRSGRGLRQVTRHQGMADAPAWSLDGKHIYYLGNYARPGEWLHHPVHIHRIPMSGGRAKDLTRDVDQWLFNMVVSDTANSSLAAVKPYWDGEEERLAVVQNEHGGCHLYSVSAEGGRLRREMVDKVNILGLSVIPETGQAAVAAAQLMTTGNLFSLWLDGRRRKLQLTELNQKVLDSLDLTEPQEVTFRNGRTRIHGWILPPPGFARGRRYPTILEIHGGPMAQYGYTFFHEMHLLAAQGYVVVFTNPRGSSGYGLKFMNCIEGDWGNLDYADLMAVTDTVERLPYVDRRRMGVTGGSYGGFMTTWVVGHTDRFRAAVTQRQAGNFLTFFGAGDFGYYDFFSFKVFPWEDPAKYLRMSPNYFAHHVKTPLLIIHSENDLRCPISQAEELFAFLKVMGKTVELVRFEGESHGLSRGGRPQNRLERLNRMVDWFRRYL